MTNQSKNLIIFIDAFPYFSLAEAKFLSTLPNKSKITPGFGYSVNVKAELFGGYKPDEVEYLCEWMYDASSTLRQHQRLFNLLKPFSFFYYLDRVTHKVVSKLLGQNVYNIPFEVLGLYKKTGVPAYEDSFKKDTLFSRLPGLRKVLYSKYSTDRDKKVFEEATQVIRSNGHTNFFLSLADLDFLMHRHGIDSSIYDAKIQSLDVEIEELWDRFQKLHSNANLLVISDHGMATVDKSVRIDLESQFGKISEKSYVCFLDATICRVWIQQPTLQPQIEDYLEQSGHGRVLSASVREQYGITSKTFGDIIFLLDEGGVFIPSFFGKRVPKAMHGYASELESQQGIMVSTCEQNQARYTTVEAFDFLQSTFVEH